MNTAGRLLSIYDRMQNHQLGLDVTMVKVWAKVFELPEDDPHLEDNVVVCLQATRSEIELLRLRLHALGVPEDLMYVGMTRLRNYTNVANINAGWNSFREDSAKPENRLAFSWANWTLRDEEEDVMPDEELASLKGELDALEEGVQDTDMTPYLRGFIQRQIDSIRAALRVYRVKGVKPIEEALKHVAGAYIVEKSHVEAEYTKASEPAKSVFARVGAAIKKAADIADSLDKIRKSGEGAYTLAASVAPVLLTWAHSVSTS